MRILELTHRGDELHAICTGILYCFASRVVNMAVEMTQNPVLARDGNACPPVVRAAARPRGPPAVALRLLMASQPPSVRALCLAARHAT